MRDNDVGQHLHRQRQRGVAVVGRINDVVAVLDQQRHGLAAGEGIAVRHHDAQRRFAFRRGFHLGLMVAVADFGKRRQRGSRDLQQFAPFPPTGHDFVDKAPGVFLRNVELLCQRHPFLRQFRVQVGIGQPEIGQPMRQPQHQHQTVGPRIQGAARVIRIFVVGDRPGEYPGHAPVRHHDDAEFDVVGFQTGALLDDDCLRGIGVMRHQDRAVLIGVRCRQRQLAHLRQQAADKQFVRIGHVHPPPEGLHAERHQQRVRPVPLIIKCLAGAAAVLVHQRKPQRQVTHRRHAEARDDVLYRYHRT